MTKNFWLGSMIVSFLVTTGSAGFLYRAVIDMQTVDVPLKQIPPVSQNPIAEPTPEKIVSETPEKAAPANEKPAPVMRNILFTYHNSTAKEVFLIGDFNDWKRKPLKRKNKKTWTVAQKIKPGTHNYLFVVDNKRTRDPNNKKISKNNESVITVKPLK